MQIVPAGLFVQSPKPVTFTRHLLAKLMGSQWPGDLFFFLALFCRLANIPKRALLSAASAVH